MASTFRNSHEWRQNMKDYYREMFWDDSKRVFVPNPDYIEGCARTHLIQRLSPPQEEYDGAWSFGCGYKQGGLSQEAWDIIVRLCSFEYMGSAEFEFGSIPKAFKAMVDGIDNFEAYLTYVAGYPEFPFSRRFGSYDYNALDAIRKSHSLEAAVLVLAPKRLRPHVEEVIQALTFDDIRLQEPANFNAAIFCDPGWKDNESESWNKTCGWLELDNGFMFFSNESMWRNFCALFGVPEPKSANLQVRMPNFHLVNEALAKCPKRK